MPAASTFYATAMRAIWSWGSKSCWPTGSVLDLLRTLRKDNTGYDLKQLFIGAEGTLGIITAAALKLFPKPRARATAFAGVRDPEAAVALLGRLQEQTGGLVSAFELISRIGLEFVLRAYSRHCTIRSPCIRPGMCSSKRRAPTTACSRKSWRIRIGAALDAGEVADAVFAASEAQRAALWRLRESVSEAQKFEGGSIKHDISVPVKDVPAFLEQACATVAELVPGIRPVPFGHLGDGNIHFNLSVPKGADDAAFSRAGRRSRRVVHDIVWDFGGSISAEHGFGFMKREEILRYKSDSRDGHHARAQAHLRPQQYPQSGESRRRLT